MIHEFIQSVAGSEPTPAGGSVAALAGALAAALGEKICAATLRRRSMAQHYPKLNSAQARLAELRNELELQVEKDAASYRCFLDARRRSKEGLDADVESASQQATAAPLRTAELATEVRRLLEPLPAITIRDASADLSVALMMAEASRMGAIETVHANLESMTGGEFAEQAKKRLEVITLS